MDTVGNGVRMVNLMVAGMLAGNEFGTRVAVHPALANLPVSERIRAEQELTRRYAGIMPFWMSSAVVSCLPNLALSWRTTGFLPTLVGTGCLATSLASTLSGNVPTNNRVLELSPETDQEEFGRLRQRWDRLHALRVVLNVAGMGALCLGTLEKRGK